MIKKGLYFFVTGWLGAMTPAMAAENTCVTCHQGIEGKGGTEHSFNEWSLSPHAKSKVSCAACHKGNPSGKTAQEAHAGLLPSTDVKSPVYFTQIPATCGACHQAEFKAFKKSAHYKELQKSGRGPNCVTCHGSMANHVLAPRELEMTCTLCHRRPTQAYATLIALNNAGSSIGRFQAALEAVQSSQLDVAQQKTEFQETKKLHQQMLADWHTFKMEEVLKKTQEITRRAANALNELKIKGLQEDGTLKP